MFCTQRLFKYLFWRMSKFMWLTLKLLQYFHTRQSALCSIFDIITINPLHIESRQSIDISFSFHVVENDKLQFRNMLNDRIHIFLFRILSENGLKSLAFFTRSFICMSFPGLWEHAHALIIIIWIIKKKTSKSSHELHFSLNTTNRTNNLHKFVSNPKLLT